MVSFIDEYRVDHGVEPICKQLPIAPSTYHEHEARERDSDRESNRSIRDRHLEPEIERVWTENFEVHILEKLRRRLTCVVTAKLTT